MWKLSKVYRFGLLWMSTTMLPTLFIVYQTSRYHYLPLVGVGIIVGQGMNGMLMYFQKKNSRKAIFGIWAGFILILFYFIIGIHLEEQYYALYGEIHRQAAESFKQNILPKMPKDAHAVAVFFKQDSKIWAEDLYAEYLLNPWYFPGTYKWVYRRHQAVLGLSNTYGFVSYCAYNDVNTLFVKVPYKEFRNRLLSGDFYIIIHDYDTNTFRFGADALKTIFVEYIDNRNFYDFLQSGRFDPTNTGTLYFDL